MYGNILQVRTSGNVESERTSLVPGLALSCEPPPLKFKSWEKQERRGGLKSMFNWEVRGKQTFVKPEPASKDADKRQTQNLPKKEAKKEKSCKKSFDRKVLKVLTKGKGKRSTTKNKEVSEKDGWRGPREVPSEIPVKRRVLKKKNQVKLTHEPHNDFHHNLRHITFTCHIDIF